MKKKAFTLIELIAVLVILAILALVVTPLVMNIIRKARISADKRSIDTYGRSVDGYTYGNDKSPSYTAYKVEDEVTYNNINYYVIKDSGIKESTVTLLKAEPLSAEEIATYSEGTGARTDGDGGMQYHSSSNAYEGSYVKTTVDAWKSEKAPAASETRLIKYDEFENLGYVKGNVTPSNIGWVKTEKTPSWVYNENYWYWTMTPYNDSSADVWFVSNTGGVVSDHASGTCGGAYCGGGYVRPVITISKSAI